MAFKNYTWYTDQNAVSYKDPKGLPKISLWT